MQAIWDSRQDIVLAVGLISNILTILLSVIALWGLVVKRKQLGLAFQMLLTSHLDRRMTRVRETLTRLESLNYDKKTQRGEVRNLLAQLCGSLAAISEESDELSELVDELHEYHHENQPLTENNKRYLLSKLQGILDEIDHDARVRVLGRDKS